MPTYELTDELREALGTAGREHMACRHARFLLENKPHVDELFCEGRISGPFHWKGECGFPGLTVWEIEIGQRLARLLKPEYLKEQLVIAEAAQKKEEAEAAQKKEDAEAAKAAKAEKK